MAGLADLTSQVDPLVPGTRPPDPGAPPRAALGEMFPYMQQSTGLASFQPNVAGKIPEVDPLANWQPYAQGAIDVASMFGPEVAAKGLGVAALHLMPMLKEPLGGLTTAEYKILNDAGEHVLDLNTSFNPKNKSLYIDWVGTPGNEQTDLMPLEQRLKQAANTIGPSEIRSLIGALKTEYPEMKTITGLRISGARKAAEEAAGQAVGLYVPDPVLRVRK